MIEKFEFDGGQESRVDLRVLSENIVVLVEDIEKAFGV